MAYAPPTESELHQVALDAYVNKLEGATVREGDELWARAWVVAAATAHVSAGLEYVEDNLFPDTADLDATTRWAAIYEVDRLQPTVATEGGKVLALGLAATVIPIGSVLRHEDSTSWETTAEVVLTGAPTEVPIQAQEVGSAGNLSEGTVLTWESPPAGLEAEASVSSELSGGTDEEELVGWQTRIVDRIRAGTGSGTAADYERWAEEVDGVVAAHCLPLRLGPGSASVAVFSADAGGNRQPAGSALRAVVLAHLDGLRPVTAAVDCPAVDEVALNITVSGLAVTPGFDDDAVIAAVEAALEAWTWSLTTGATARLTQLGRTIANVAGVDDYQIDAPVADVAVAADSVAVQILVPGTISVSLA